MRGTEWGAEAEKIGSPRGVKSMGRVRKEPEHQRRCVGDKKVVLRGCPPTGASWAL